MNKTLKFATHLVPLILDGSKTSTWRLWDDKDLTEGDVVDFLESGTNRLVATGKLTKVYEKTLGTLTAEDKQGHEQFESDGDMYQHYKEYYNREVGADTPLKIIHYELYEE
jgi:hypothetical protein